MFLSEQQVKYLTTTFMPKLREKSVSAMIDVACNGMSILGSAGNNKVTHQSLSKNLLQLKKLQNKIAGASDKLPNSYLLEENARALLMAKTSFIEAKRLLIDLCRNLGGNDKPGNLSIEEVKLYLGGSVTCIYRNPDSGYQYEWGFGHNDAV